ncbi:unnamed protein product, partial [Allacma fusca]
QISPPKLISVPISSHEFSATQSEHKADSPKTPCVVTDT